MAAAAEGAVDVDAVRPHGKRLDRFGGKYALCMGRPHSENPSMPAGGVAVPASAWPSFAAQTPESHSSK